MVDAGSLQDHQAWLSDPRPSFALPNKDEWYYALTRAKAALDKYQRLGIPVKGGRKNMLLIYAWNEYGEGGIVGQTKGEQGMKLEAVRQVFGE